MRLREGVVLVRFHDRAVRVDDAVDAGRGKGQVLLGVFVALVVEKNAAEPPGFAAVLDHEVLVSPRLELGVIGGVVLAVKNTRAEIDRAQHIRAN